MEIARQTKARNLGLAVFVGALVIAYIVPLGSLFSFAWNDDTFSYIPLVPFISAFFLYEKRKEIFLVRDGLYVPGGAAIVIGIVLYLLAASQGIRFARVDRFTVMSLSFVFCSMGGLGLFYGPSAWKAAAFPIFFLLFMAPVPGFLLDRIVRFLQVGSAEASAVIFRLTGVPVYREGFVFQLPGLSIEVAEQCSGIRSSLSLLLTSLLAGHIFLKRGWSRAALALSVVPIAIVKNGIRIVALGLLGAYVSPAILGTDVHKRGGYPIFALAFVLLMCVLWVLRKIERKEAD